MRWSAPAPWNISTMLSAVFHASSTFHLVLIQDDTFSLTHDGGAVSVVSSWNICMRNCGGCSQTMMDCVRLSKPPVFISETLPKPLS